MKIAVYSPNWIGDAVMAIPFIQELKKQNLQSELFIICKDWVSAVYKNHSDINQIIHIPDHELRSLTGTIKTGLMLRSLRIDLFYTLTDSFRSALILRMSGAKNRYGYATQMRTFLLTNHKLINPKKAHRSKKYLGLLSSVSINMEYPKLRLTNSEKHWAEKEMKKIGFYKPIAILPFSVMENRTLPNVYLKEWINESKNEYLVFGSKKDINKGDTLIRICENNIIKSICGDYTLRETMLLMSICDFTIATDSGLGHISAALGLPTVSFFSVGNKNITAPIGEKTIVVNYCNPCKDSECSQSDNGIRCIKKITKLDIENVIDKMSSL